ncbi:hypothetical protein [Flavobacterium ovatum]|uniref:hypothetical protein n=1 Tax=Flavobacterium ovatum TaxID=1928857 RepID=UPI00344DEEAD
MRTILLHIIIIWIPLNSYGQSIFKNSINDTNPSLTNPYINGQTFDQNLNVSGIGRGTGINGNTGGNRYNARDWNTSNLDTNDYFEFSITPQSGYKLNLTTLEYKAQISATAGPINFAFRSSVDGFTNNISTPTILNSGSETTPQPIDLSSSEFQNINLNITFRFYAWGGSNTTGTFSINEFSFNGIVSCNSPTPTIDTIKQPDCNSKTGTVTLINLPTPGTWDLYQDNSLIQSGGIGNTATVVNINAGNHKFKIANNYCSSAFSTEVSINSNTTTWDGISWSNGNPSNVNHIVFNNYYSSTNPIECCSCQVNSGNVVIHGGHTLKITNGLNIVGGKLTFDNNASLIQLNDFATNFGSITYQRQTTPVSNLDYTYWSSPVTGFTIGAVSPNTLSGKWYSYNATINNWRQESASTIMNKGIGYIIRGPESNKSPNPPNIQLASFIGIPNNGIISTPITGNDHSNLIGNPYPSAIDADSFITQNSTLIDGTLFFWTHNTSIQLATNITNGTAGSGKYAYTSDDYASYNLTGGVAAFQTPTISGRTNTDIPTGNIAAGQGFFVTGSTTGNIKFSNSMRIGNEDTLLNNSQFFKTYTTVRNNVINKNRIWLNLTNNQGAYKQILVGYITNASNDFENNFDGQTFDSNPYIDFYSTIGNKKLVIQGKGLPFDELDIVPLGYRSDISGEFSINLSQVDGNFINKPIYIEDKITNSIRNIKDGPYTFTSEKGIFDNRFILRYTNDKLTRNSIEKSSKDILIYKKNHCIKIKSLNENIEEIIIIDLIGNQLLKRKNINSNQYTALDLPSENQILVVKIVLKNKQLIVKKIVY